MSDDDNNHNPSFTSFVFGNSKMCGDETETKRLLKSCSQLYGRHEEQRQLLEAFRTSQTRNRARSMVVIIKGVAGSGKTALIDSLREHIRKENGTMFYWSSDRQNGLHVSPGFAVAVRKWVDDMLQFSQADLEKWRQQTVDRFDPFELTMLRNYVPCMNPLLRQPAQENSTFNTKDYRFDWSVFQKFLKSSCSLDFPLLYVFDDFQWVEETTLRMVSEKIDASGNEDGSFFIFSYNSELVNSKSLWYQELKEVTAKGCDVVEITLQNLQKFTTQSIIADILGVVDKTIDHVGEWIHQRTQGNPLFTLELTRGLYSRGLLSFDVDTGSWTLDVDEASEHCGNSTTCCEYLTRRLKELPDPLANVLKTAACMGLCFDENLVSAVVSEPARTYILAASQAGILASATRGRSAKSIASHKQKVDWLFVHNTMQEAILCIVGPNSDQEQLHLKIGQTLIAQLSDKEFHRNLLFVMGQLVKGGNFIASEDSIQFAHFALQAARRAVEIGSFESAKKSTCFALRLIQDKSWNEDYNLIMAVHNVAAEVAYAIGDFEDLERLVSAVLRGARCFDEKLQANLTKMHALGSAGHTCDAISLGFSLLEELGETFPANPTRFHVKCLVFGTRWMLSGKSDDDLLRLPTMKDSQALSSIQIMNMLFSSAFFDKPLLAPLLAMRMVQLSVKHGLCAVSSVSFAVYGTLLMSKRSTINEGIRMGEISFKILDRYKVKAWIPRVYAVVFGFIHCWTHPHQTLFEPLLRGYRMGMATGDIEFAMVNLSLFLFKSFESGKNLIQIEQDYNRYIPDVLVAHHQKNTMILMSSPFRSTVRILMGKAKEFEPYRTHVRLNWAEVQKIFIAIILCRYEEAVKLGHAFLQNCVHPYEELNLASVYVFVGIANIALFKETGMRNQSLRSAAIRCLKKVDHISTLAPDFCLATLTLLQAEMSSMSPHRHRYTSSKYLASIALANSAKNLFYGALANERYSRYLWDYGDKSLSLAHRRSACSIYEEWDAILKVQMLQEEIEIDAKSRWTVSSASSNT